MTESTEEDLDPCLVCVATGNPKPRPPRAGYTCDRCLVRMRRQLDDLPAFYVWAGSELLPGRGDGRRSSETSLGLNVSALDLRLAADVLGTLGGWARIFREDLEFPAWLEPVDDHGDPTGATLVELVRFLQGLLGRVAASHPAVDEFAVELAAVHGAAQSAARAAPRQAWVVSCPIDDPESRSGRCGSRIRVTGEDFGGWVRCRRCGTGWDVTRLLHVVAHDRASSVWLPAEEVALLYGVSERTLLRYARDGRVRREHGRYELASVRHAMLGLGA